MLMTDTHPKVVQFVIEDIDEHPNIEKNRDRHKRYEKWCHIEFLHDRYELLLLEKVQS